MSAKLFETLGHLPVAEIAPAVAASVLGGTVTVVASATGSGKTLLLPPSLALASDEQIVVLVPRRFLAVNAAETVCDLSGLTVGEEVGFAVGAQSGENSHWSVATKVFYCTYGYAIASGLIHRASTIVLDEVHEASLDMSIVRALLHRRLAAGERVNILEMSATINAAHQAAYWQQVAPVQVMEIDGRTFPCVRRHRPASPIEDEVKTLLEEGRTGILVFRPGRGEVEDTAAAIRKKMGDAVEVAEIYGELDYQLRKQAVAMPNGKAKVLVGTNVVESGANIPWLDSGVSCGTAKEISVRPETGATYLGLIDLPRWRLEQQEGRVKRFRDGIFVLCAEKSHDQREAETTPEIKRLPLTELVMHCAGFGIRAEELVFDHAPDRDRILEAEIKLQRLGLIDTQCRLTPAGQWVTNLPVGPETGAMLWYAKETGVLAAALPLAAVIEVDGIRKDFRESHDLNTESDWLDALAAFQMIYDERDAATRKRYMERWNVSYKRFDSARELLHDLKRRFDGEGSVNAKASAEQLKLCLVAGFVTNLFTGRQMMTPVVSDQRGAYNVGHGSATTAYLYSGYALGQLRTIQPRDKTKPSFTILEKVTSVSLEDILKVAAFRPSLVTSEMRRDPVAEHPSRMMQVTTHLLFGEFKLGEGRQMVTATPVEVDAMAAARASREAYISRLRKLNRSRVQVGLSELSFNNQGFIFPGWGKLQPYTEENIVKAEKDSATEVGDRMKALRSDQPIVKGGSAPFEALSQMRKQLRK
ncbi:MAG: hypothetical protein DI585_01585 [Pseudomonas fluorescens]|nr:MAG: hypothetical protein DI585_01585 [Pseudomonas fluorescens]